MSGGVCVGGCREVGAFCCILRGLWGGQRRRLDMALAGTAKDAVVAGVMVLADFGFSADDAGFAFGFGVGASA